MTPEGDFITSDGCPLNKKAVRCYFSNPKGKEQVLIDIMDERKTSSETVSEALSNLIQSAPVEAMITIFLRFNNMKPKK
jgi:hypothetical protein